MANHNKLGLSHVTLAAAMVTWLATASPSLAQLDATWTLKVAGQTIPVNPDGSWTVNNIPAGDSFGPGGPGTPPDGFSDEEFRVTGTSQFNGITRTAISAAFRIPRDSGTFQISDLVITSDPAALPEGFRRAFVASVGIAVTPDVLIETGATGQVITTLTLSDGSLVDATPAGFQTAYRTSNPAIATIDENGVITGVSAGLVGITATNLGATAVKLVRVVPPPTQPPTTDVSGFVQLESGAPVDGATVTLAAPQAGLVITGPDGRFSFPQAIANLGPITVVVSATINTQQVSASVIGLDPIAGGLTDAGIVTLIVDSTAPPLAQIQAIVVGAGGELKRGNIGTLALIDTLEPCGPFVLTDAMDSLNALALNDVDVTADGSTAVVVGSFPGTFQPEDKLAFINLQTSPPTVTGILSLPWVSNSRSEGSQVRITTSGFAIVAGSFDRFASGPAGLVVVDIATQTVASALQFLPGTASPVNPSIDVSPDGTLLFVRYPSFDAFGNFNRGVRVYSIATDGTLTDTGVTYSVPTNPFFNPKITVSPNGRFALADHVGINSTSTGYDEYVIVLNLVQQTVTDTIFIGSIGFNPRRLDIAITPDASEAYVYDRRGRISVLDIDPNGIATNNGTSIDVPLYETPSIIPYDSNTLSVTPDGANVLVFSQDLTKGLASFWGVTVIDVATKSIVESVSSFTGFLLNMVPIPTPINLSTVVNDCNMNGSHDECEIFDGTSISCNGNLVPDVCELLNNDCNLNGIPDECDIASGVSLDANANAIPDECEP